MTSAAGTPASVSMADSPAQPETRQEYPVAEASTSNAKAKKDPTKDRSLAEFMLMLDEYEPLVRVYVSPSLKIKSLRSLIHRYQTKLPTTTSNASVLRRMTSGCTCVLHRAKLCN